jgi:hypothetical protein
MQITLKKAVSAFFMLFSMLMVLLGIAFIWHYIPPNNWLGILPEAEYIEDELWYKQNAWLGWALVFCGFTTFSFAFFTRKQAAQTGRYVLGVLVALALSLVLATIALEVLTSFLNS